MFPSHSRGRRLPHARRLFVALLSSLLLFASFAATLPRAGAAGSSAAAQTNPSAPALNKSRNLPEFVAGEILVRFRPSAKETAKTTAAPTVETLQVEGRAVEMRLERVAASEMVEGLRLARVEPAETLSAIESLKKRADVLYAEPNYVRRALRTPNDPHFAEQYALKNTGLLGGTAGADIKAETAWDVTTGSRSVVVGIVDEGLDVNHPDLRDNIWTNPAETPGNGIDDDGNGYADDVNGYDFFHNDASVYDASATDNATDAHGTHVAGIVGAVGNNGAGVAGVNWQVSLMSLKVLGRTDESPASSSVLTTVRAYNYAKQMRDLWVSTGGAKGANLRVLNNSYGGYGHSQAELDAIRALADSGILFVAAAGNENNSNDANPAYPASYQAPNVISVTATDRTGQFVFGLYNYGQRTVHMAAPGVGVLSTMPHGTYSELSGTSMAAPHVAGAAALLLADNPSLPVARLRSALLYSGDEISSLSSRTTTGRSLNASAALQNARESDTTPPAAVGNFHITTQNGRTVALEWTAPGDDANAGRASLYELRFSDTNPSDPAQFDGARLFLEVPPRPAQPGTVQNTVVRVPFRHTGGFVAIRAVDNAGNAGPVSVVPVSVDLLTADPYTVSQSAPSALTTGGTPLNLHGDDAYLENYQLPYDIPLFDQRLRNVTISSNGALYFSMPPAFLNIPRLNDGTSLDALSSVALLNTRGMIAGLWDDLRTDRRAGDDVYMVVEPTRVVFRWQAVTYNTQLTGNTTRGEQPVNFEIELGRNGTIQLRYGAGQSAPINTQLFPVVGLSGGPDAYLVESHTSEDAPKSLTNAPTVTFTMRNPPPPPSNDIQVTMTDAPDPVFSGQQLTYVVDVRNATGIEAYNVVMNDQLPAGTTFVSCVAFNVPCTSNGANAVTANIGTLGSSSTARITITVRVDAPPDTVLVNTASASSLFTDPVPANNTASVETRVIRESFFGGVKQIATGIKHTLALKTDGTVWAWGDGGSGKMGDGGVWAGKTPPLQVTGLSDAIAVAAGDEHSMALRADGTVWTWGSNSYGQLGEAARNQTNQAMPKPVPNLSGVVAISAGGDFSVALKSDGTVWSWGLNNDGMLGNGSTSPLINPTPGQVANLSGVVAIAAGRWHTLALRNDGTVWAWGLNFNQMGIPGTTRVVSAPIQINGLAGIKAIAAGQGHTVALKTDGTVLALGNGRSGQLGTNTAADSTTPVTPVGMTNAVAIAAGAAHTLVLKQDGTLWSFGANSNGELGDGTSGAGKARPVQVTGISGVVALAAKDTFSAAILNDGTLRMWGNNTYGQLGDNTNLNRSTPTPVSGLCSVSAPTFTPEGGNYTSPILVKMTTVTEGARIHYTRDGREPTEADPSVGSGESVFLDSYTDLRAKAFRSGWRPSSTKALTYFFIAPANRIDDARFFVQQHYRDFFSREADTEGLNFWTGVINECARFADAQTRAACIDNRRANVSAAFFLSTEFQKTGYLVYRLEKASYARMPRFSPFLSDTQAIGQGVVVNSPGWEEKLETNTRTFLDMWVGRSAFKALYDGLSNADYVNRLFENAGVVPTLEQRNALVGGLNAGTETRATVLRKVAENEAFYRQEYNPAFVLMQYFGYLRRNPDDPPEETRDFAGYNFWLTKLNNHGGNYISAEMVRSFLISGEYRNRFLQ